jgi:hypothetical protein
MLESFASPFGNTDDGALDLSRVEPIDPGGFTSPSAGGPNTDFVGFDGSLASSPPRKRSPNDDVFVPPRVPKPLLPLKELNPPLVGSEVVVVGVKGEEFTALLSADVEPKTGFELPRAEGLPKAGVVDPDFGDALIENDPEEDAKTDTGLVPASFGGL